MLQEDPHLQHPLDSLLVPDQVHYQADPADGNTRLDSFLALRMRWRSRTSIQKLIQDGKVELTRRDQRSRLRKASTTILDGDMVHVGLPRPKRDLDWEEQDRAEHAADAGLQILYEDADLLAVNKPPNVPVHPAGRNLYRTVITTLHRIYRRPDDPERDIVPKLCHRIDLETSGVLLVAKDDQIHRELSRQFRERTPEKSYLAIVHGVPEPEQGLIDLPIGPALTRRVACAYSIRHDIGQQAQTEYRVVGIHGNFALLSINLLTGRHHQIRVHLTAIGHPLVGDKIYGQDDDLFIKYYDGALTEEDEARLMLPRQALHAHRLKVTHPRTGEPLEIEAPLPADLAAFLDEKSR